MAEQQACPVCGTPRFADDFDRPCLKCRGTALHIPLVSPGPWIEDALCAQVDPDTWYPQPNTNEAKVAKKVCMTCPVRQECLQYALDNDEVWGIWGGTSYRERKRLKMKGDTAA
jgi:WhiB family redox-sensing transcriptional regulator